MFFTFFSEKNSWSKTFLVECVRSGAASCNKRREFWRETRTPLWLLIGRIIFLTREQTSFAILIGRIIFFTCENHRSLLWLARTNLSTKIYDIAFWWVFLSMYIINAISSSTCTNAWFNNQKIDKSVQIWKKIYCMNFFVLLTYIEQVYSRSTNCYILWNVNLKYFFLCFGICLAAVYRFLYRQWNKRSYSTPFPNCFPLL